MRRPRLRATYWVDRRATGVWSYYIVSHDGTGFVQQGPYLTTSLDDLPPSARVYVDGRRR